ncbi:Putative uncharacterized transposon-derived protein [Frankliniella fusca]|uniref:Uncharacterized transposon-derived protein n=1 Tax=Frankliniella fusca TaxID=407009 RepID=A0AAE1H7B5_9NEOP|nr:Putative uncharacterized transposon-derived protein [Frankliniella fusca]KAK3911109.1 Putative uncharacterized transposon-derived protein [Frankliniella fusca]KAK3915984.1 Putative uncharacterized transposon-derived protein [Frankliniella fusca]KAK3926093.1 Putative uncharacterized transposon-derived protein [Frankliniella fusca]
MEHCKKLVLVPHETVAKLQEKNPVERTPEVVMNDLDREMQHILKQKAEDREKWKLYEQALQKYLYFVNERKKPIELYVPDLGSSNHETTLKQKLLSITPRKFQESAAYLLDHLSTQEAKKFISWDENGRTLVGNQTLPSIIDLVSDAVRTRDSPKINNPKVDQVLYHTMPATQTKQPSISTRKTIHNQNGSETLTGNDGIDSIFKNTRHPAGFSNVERLKNASNSHRNQIVEYLQGQDAYTLHKRARRTFPRNVTYADNIDDCWQADLADFSALKDDNQKTKFILCVIDVFSRFAWTVPVLNKQALTIKHAFETLFKNTTRRPTRLITDKGGELKNKTLKQFLQEHGIDYAHTNNPDTKCSVVERFIGTLRMWMQKVFTHRESYEYTNGVLDDVTHAYNNKRHSALKMTPTQASDPKRVLEVYHNLYGKKLNRKQVSPKLKVGDYVRISREKKRFEKGCTWNWSEEIFKITRVIPHAQPVYRIADLDNNEELEGTFYSWELSPVKKPEMFKIAYIVKTRGKGPRKEVFVHWRGYPESSRSWILAKDLTTT